MVVGCGLILIGLLYLVKFGLISFQIPNWINTYFYWIIPLVFITRALGDFNYVGIFKKIKDTDFAMADSRIFIHLCLTIGALGFAIQLFT
ncbi:MAG: DUF3995 domain-containing protein [Crocinitomicaceae bacterium]